MIDNTLKIKAMKVVLTLQRDKFPNGSNTKTIYSASLPGYLHIDALINRQPGWEGNNAIVTIYGMTVEDCNALTRYNTLNVEWYNQVQVFADYIDVTANQDGTYSQEAVIAACDKLPLIYMGIVISAGANFNDPNRPFTIQSTIIFQALAALGNSTSINQPTTLSAAIQSMINDENNTNPELKYKLISIFPVEQQINNANYIGSFASKLKQICTDYNYQVFQTFENDGTIGLVINQVGITNDATPKTLSSQTGMIGYPIVMPFGIMAKEFFNPNTNVNDVIYLDTDYTAINSSKAGNYVIWQMSSNLQTNGSYWDSSIVLYNAVKRIG